MLKKLFKPFYTLILLSAILIISNYLIKNNIRLDLNNLIIITITVILEYKGYFNSKENVAVSLSMSLCILMVLIFGPLTAILTNILVFTIPPFINDYTKGINIKFIDRIIRVIYNISQSIINVFIAERMFYYLNTNLDNPSEIWKIILIVLAYYYSNAILITLIITFNSGKYTNELISFKKNYNIIGYLVLLTPVLIYNYYDRGFIGLSFILIIVYTMGRSIEAYRRWKEQEDKIFRDELTGAYNLRYFKSILETNIFQRKNFSLIMIDINNFRYINEIHGHIASDYLLKKVAKVILEVINDNGILCRYVGDEFSVILDQDLDAFQISSQIIKSINDLKINYRNKVFSFSANIGYIRYKGEEVEKEELIERVDKALIKAKKSNLNIKICEAI